MEIAELRLGVLVPGCAEARDGGIAVTSRVGPLVEMLAELVSSTTVLGYEKPGSGEVIEDRTDFVMRPKGDRARLLSLGPRGSYRDYLGRRRRVRRIVAEASREWDLVFLPLTNRRVGLVYGALKCRRVVAQLGGHTPNVARARSMSLARKSLALAASNIAARTYRRVAKESLFFVNGEALLPLYESVNPAVAVVRTSARRAAHRHEQSDRMTDGKPKVAIISRLTEPKGVFEAIDAFAMLRNEFPEATLHIVGDGDAVGAMRSRIEELGLASAVSWYGWVPPGPELFEIYKRMDVLVTLSLAESLPNTVWEALAHSVLVVTTPVGALPLAFKDGEELLFVPVRNAEAAANALKRLATDESLRRGLLDRGLRRSEEASVENVARRLLDAALERWPELRSAGGPA